MPKRLIFTLCLLLLPTVARSEKLLIKNGGEYLGKKTSSQEFKTCHGGLLKIGNGTIANTDDRCSQAIVGPITGSIAKIAKRLVVNDSHGNEVSFDLTAEERNRLLREFGIGTSLRITFENGERRFERN